MTALLHLRVPVSRALWGFSAYAYGGILTSSMTTDGKAEIQENDRQMQQFYNEAVNMSI